jgi:hypothetical protein
MFTPFVDIQDVAKTSPIKLEPPFAGVAIEQFRLDCEAIGRQWP